MKPSNWVGLCLFALAGTTGCTAEASAPLVGTWSLVSVTATAADGTVDSEPYGSDPTGYLTYSSNGYMQVILSFSDRAMLSGHWRMSPPEERAAAFATSLSYAGRYWVADGEVTHHAEVSSEPNRVGTSQVRAITWQDGQLTLTTPPIEVGNSASAFALTWRRVEE